MIAERFQQQLAFQIDHQQLKNLRMLEMPQHVHLPFGESAFGAVGVVELARQFLPECWPIGQLIRAARRQQLIEQKGYTDEELPSPEVIRQRLNELGYHLKRVKKVNQ